MALQTLILNYNKTINDITVLVKKIQLKKFFFDINKILYYWPLNANS